MIYRQYCRPWNTSRFINFWTNHGKMLVKSRSTILVNGSPMFPTLPKAENSEKGSYGFEQGTSWWYTSNKVDGGLAENCTKDLIMQRYQYSTHFPRARRFLHINWDGSLLETTTQVFFFFSDEIMKDRRSRNTTNFVLAEAREMKRKVPKHLASVEGCSVSEFSGDRREDWDANSLGDQEYYREGNEGSCVAHKRWEVTWVLRLR